jgi:hypothetical protein
MATAVFDEKFVVVIGVFKVTTGSVETAGIT